MPTNDSFTKAALKGNSNREIEQGLQDGSPSVSAAEGEFTIADTGG